MKSLFLCLGLSILTVIHGSTSCICTTVPCPEPGENTLIMGNGTAVITYDYVQHGDFIVVSSANGEITPIDLDHGTDTTSCTQQYARMLDDDGVKDCDAGHILANRLGGYGNEPLNIFPQDASVNRGIYAQFENDIYQCIVSGAKSASLRWNFAYSNETQTKPNSVEYSASFNGGDCTEFSDVFTNLG